MRAGAQARSILAGTGVTGSLVAAIAAAFAVTGGVLAFTGWPGSSVTGSAPALDVAELAAPAATGAAHAAPALQLAAPAPATPAGPVATIPRRTAGRPGGPSLIAPATVPQGTPPVSPPGTPSPAAPPAPTSPLAATVTSATGATARTLRSVGGFLPPAAPVTDGAAAAVDTAGQTVGGLLQSLTPHG